MEYQSKPAKLTRLQQHILVGHSVLSVLCRLNKMLWQDMHCMWKGDEKWGGNLIATWPPRLSEQWANHTGSRGNYQDLRWTTNGFTAPVPYSDRRGRGALGTTCKPNTSPHSICCLINLINGSFNAPQRQPSQYCRETKTDNGSLVRWKQFWGWLPFSIKV